MIDVKDFDIAVEAMDDDIREDLAEEFSPCSKEVFLREYEARHLEIFGKPFRI